MIIFILDPSSEFNISYKFIINRLNTKVKFPQFNKYNFGISYYIKLINKNIVTNNSIANVTFLFGIGKEFYYNSLILNFSNNSYTFETYHTFKYYYECYHDLVNRP